MQGPRLALRIVLGAALFALGVIVALLRLPEWRSRSIPDEAFFAERLAQSARQAGLAIEAEPRSRLRSQGWIEEIDEFAGRDTAYLVLGPDAADWLAATGRGPFVETRARSRWAPARDTGELRVLFSVRGVPVSAVWLPDDPFRGRPANERAQRRVALLRVFAPGISPAAEKELSVLGQSLHLTPVPGSTPPESLLGTTGGGIPFAQRAVGSTEWWQRLLEGLTVGSLLVLRLPDVIVGSVVVLGTLGLFVLLLVRRRIELVKGAVLGAVSIALSMAGPIRDAATLLEMMDALAEVVTRGLALFVLWSAAESWVRSTVPTFRTSLDALRAGRLGPTAGRAFLAGWSYGAAAAGLWLIAFAAATFVPHFAPLDASLHLPLFGRAASPVDEGAIRTGFVLLALCAALRWPYARRIRGSAIVLAALGIATRLPLTPFWVAVAAALILAVLMVRAYAAFGLTALLAAAMTSTVLPAALFSVLHAQWLPWPAALLVAVAVLPIVLGVIGVRRGEEAEHGPLPVPAFVRRLEEENRVKHEMELLARMQLGLLPQETPHLEGWEIAARSILATEAGGDLYDFVHDASGRVWIAAGDVSGHGYSCAIAQAMTKAGLASLVEAERTPATVLDRLDRVLRGIGSARTFTSLALMRLDPATGEAILSNAGHPYPWIVAEGQPRELELPSLPLGQGPVRQYGDAPLSFEPGTTLVFVSDGLFEAVDPSGHAYGFDRIRQLLANVWRRPAEAILNALVEDWRTHAGAAAPADDTTIVVVKRRG